MLLVTQSKASTIPYAPSRAYLNKLAQSDQLPKYFVWDEGKLKVNIDDPEWIAWLEEREKENPELVVKTPKGLGKLTAGKHSVKSSGKQSGKSAGKKKITERQKPTTKGKTKRASLPGVMVEIEDEPEDEEERDEDDLTAEQIKLKDLVSRSRIALLEEQILKNEGIRYQNEIKKIQLKKEAGEIIDFDLANFLFFGYMERQNIELLSLSKKIEPIIDNLVKDGNTKGILKRYDREFETIIKEIKTAQKKDVDEWETTLESGKKK